MTRLDAFLNRCLLRLFDDSPGLASYLDRAEVDGKRLIVVFDELPRTVIVKMPPAFGASSVKAFKAAEHGVVKTAFVIVPSEADLEDLKAYPEVDQKDLCAGPKKSEDEVPTRVTSAAGDKGGSRLPASPGRT